MTSHSLVNILLAETASAIIPLKSETNDQTEIVDEVS